MVVEKNVQLDTVSIMKVQNLSVSLTIPFYCSPHSIGLLRAFNPCLAGEVYEGYHEGALAYSLFLLIREKLIGSAVDGSRSRVDHVVCAAHGNDFVISWNTQGTGTMLRKVTGIALGALLPNSLYSRYSYCIKLLGGKADRAEFDYLAGKMIDAIDSSVHIVAVGKINTNTDLKALLATAFGKFSKSKKVSGKAPEKHPPHSEAPAALKCDTGASAIIVADYISHTVPMVQVCGKHINIFAGNWGSKHQSLKDKERIAKYCKVKFDKLGAEAGPRLAYTANSGAMGSGSSILAVAKKTDAKSAIVSNL